jgi:hypothetical protein
VIYKEELECFFIARIMTKVRIKPDSEIKSATEVIFSTNLRIKFCGRTTRLLVFILKFGRKGSQLTCNNNYREV